MANFDDPQSIPNPPIKAFILGESGSGKTGALLSLAAAGYKVRIMDFDNGTDILGDYVRNPESIYLKANEPLWTQAQAETIRSRIHWETLTDKFRNQGGTLVPKASDVWTRATKILNDWPGLGPVANWGPDCVLSIDSMTMAAKAATRWQMSMNNAAGASRPSWEIIGAAQDLLIRFIETLYDENIQCNVLYNCHIRVQPRNPKDDMSPHKGFPETIGKAISPIIGRYVNTMLMTETVGFGKQAKRRLSTVGNELIELKSTAPLRIKPDYPLATGLAEYFLAVRGPLTPTQEPPNAV